MDRQFETLRSALSTLIALQIVTLVVLVAGGFYLFERLTQGEEMVGTGQPGAPENAEQWRTLVREHNAALGDEDARIVVIEFSDFQCPYCRRFSEGARRELIAEYSGDVRFVFKHFPLQEIHPEAATAAIAAQCARNEGRFWEVHERLFAVDDLSVESVIGVGEALGLSGRYVDCVVNRQTRREVEQDIEDALGIGVQGTPTFLVNGRFLVGARPVSAFEAIFQEVRTSAN